MYNKYTRYVCTRGRDASRRITLPRGNFTQHISHGRFYTIYLYPLHIYNAPTTQFRCRYVPWRVSNPNPTIRPNVETCRGASLPCDEFHAMDCMWRILHNIFISPTYNIYTPATTPTRQNVSRRRDVPWRVSTMRQIPRDGFYAANSYPLHTYNIMYISPTNNCHSHT